MKAVDFSSLKPSYDGTCGAEKGTKCSTGCCSQYGNCGTSPEHCSGACQHAFGTGCTDPDVAGSWQLALSNSKTDEEAGGQYYFDAKNRLFWTWDTPALITRKFDQIVRKYSLGGVMAWSLGEDSYDWSHIKAMSDELKKGTPVIQKSRTAILAATPAPKALTTPSLVVALGCPKVVDAPAPPKSSKDPYNIVFVDGTSEGPAGDHATQPGSPEGFVSTALSEEASTPQQKKPLAQVTSTPVASDTLPFSPEYLAAVKAAADKGKAFVARDTSGGLRKGRRVA
jgi:chitinase